MTTLVTDEVGLPGFEDGAVFTDDRLHRLRLWRSWNPDKPRVCWMMLNPSVAGAERNDLTVTKCMGFAQLWGCGGIDVVNCFTLIATNPDALATAEVPSLHEENVEAIQAAIERSTFLVVAWGDHVMRLAKKGVKEGVRAALEARGYAFLAGRPVQCLGTTKADGPRHPSRLGYATPLHLAWPHLQDPNNTPKEG